MVCAVGQEQARGLHVNKLRGPVQSCVTTGVVHIDGRVVDIEIVLEGYVTASQYCISYT